MKIKALLILMLLAFCAKAQHFTYITDRVFLQPYDLIGYTFVPYKLEIPDKEDPDNNEILELEINDYKFSITPSYLYIKGEDIEGEYSIVSINTTEYGYILSTMNAQDPSKQGHLKLVLNKKKQAQGLIFKKSRKSLELVFHITEVDEATAQAEAAYFTNMENPPITSDIVFGRNIVPFIVIGEEQSRLRIEDSISIEIRSDTVQIQKKKKVKTKIQEFIRFKYRDKDKFGVMQAFTEDYPIKKIKELRNTEDDGSPYEYLIEFTVQNLKSKKIRLYLNQKRAISMIEIGENQFLVQGY